MGGTRKRLNEGEERIHIPADLDFGNDRQPVAEVGEQDVEANSTAVRRSVLPLRRAHSALRQQLTVGVLEGELVGAHVDEPAEHTRR